MRSGVLAVDGLDVHYERWGDAGPRLLLLHGFLSGCFTWHDVAEGLAETCAVAAYDRPGAGGSARPRPPGGGEADPYTPEAAADLAVTVARRLLDGPVVMVGHSAGAAVATLAALGHPGALCGLVLVAPALRPAPPLLARAVATVPGSDRLAEIALRRWGALVGRGLRRAWHDPAGLTPARVRDYAAGLSRPGTAQAIWHAARTRRSTGPGDRLAEIRLPALVVAGADDRIVPLSEARSVAARLPDAELVELGACGHLPQEERPREFVEAVRAFSARFG